MVKRYVIKILFIFLFVFVATAQKQSVEVLHYNVLKKYGVNAREYRQQKEREVVALLAKNRATIFSVLEDGPRGFFIREQVFSQYGDYELRSVTTSKLQHSLYFNKEKVTVLQAQSYVSKQAVFFYYRLQLKEARSPVHFIIYKQPVTQHPIKQNQEILDFVNEKNIRGELVLLGGSPYPIRMLKESYLQPARLETELINIKTLFYLSDQDNKFIWHDEVDFLYVSKDVWLPKEGAVTYERKNQYLYENTMFEQPLQVELKNRPFKFRLQINEEQQKVYKTPEAKIILQNKQELTFSIIWDEDIKLNVEIVSMIGNSFLSEDIQYKGIKKEYKADIGTYPTGIYLLKIRDEEGHTVFRKFTKY